jgi:spore germination protein KB
LSQNFVLQGRQFFVLVTLYMIGNTVLTVPPTLSIIAGQDAWLSALLATAAGFGFTWLIYKVYRRFPGKNLVEMTKEVFGRKLGTFVSLLFFILFPFCFIAFTLRSLGDFVITAMIPNTPIVVVEFGFLFVVIMGVRLGMQTAAYASELFFPWVFILFFILCLALISEVKLDFIRPVFDNGIKPILRAAVPYSSFPFMESVSFLMIACHVKQGEAGKAWFSGIMVSSLFLFIVVLLCTLVLGPVQMTISIYPAFELAKYIPAVRFEFLMTFIWFVTVFFRLILLFYITVAGLASALNWQDYRFICYPVGLLALVCSILFISNVSYRYELLSVWVSYAFIWGGLYPILLLVLPKAKPKQQLP